MGSRQRCTKRQFRDEISAKMALANIARVDAPTREKMEKRAYLHKKPTGCGKWHLTSQPAMSYVS